MSWWRRGPTIGIEESGRGGSITYREGLHSVRFEWEFGGADVVAILYGPTAATFDERHRWAAGRQRAIFDHVAAEVIRRKAPSCRARVDLERGWIELYQ